MADENIGRYAVVKNGMTVNVVMWDTKSDYDPGEDAQLVKLEEDERVGIGWTYNPKATKNKWVDNRPAQEDTDGDD